MQHKSFASLSHAKKINFSYLSASVTKKRETMAESVESLDSHLEVNFQSQSDLQVIADEVLEILDNISENSQNSVDSQCSQNSGERVCEFEMMQGKRRDKTILHSITENQLYVRNKILTNGSIAYTCREDKCKARLFMKEGICYFAEPFRGHSHGDKKKEISEFKLLAQIKENCAKPTASQTTSQISEVREIFDDAVLK